MSGTAFETTDVIVVGIGGQGVLTAAEIMAEAAIAMGWDVKKTEVAGMAQRGGMVTSHLRFGPKVLAPAISAGSADVLLAFEAAEALRSLHWLRPEGLAVANTEQLIPPVVTTGKFSYPEDPIGQMKARHGRVFALPAAEIAIKVGGSNRLANTVMLGAVADFLPFGADLLLRCTLARFSKRPELADANRLAFEAGRRAAKDLAAAATAAAQ